MSDAERSAAYARDGYAIARGLVNAAAASFLCDYGLRSAQAGHLKAGDKVVPTALSGPGDPLMEALLEALLPTIEAETACSVHPTYSYYRVYRRGDVLPRHTDRPSCEISVSLALGADTERPWPLWLEVDGVATSVELRPGDGLLYKGIELPHWREPFTGEHQVQVFLHYVDRNGPHRDWMFDRRGGLRVSSAARQILGRLLSQR